MFLFSLLITELAFFITVIRHKLSRGNVCKIIRAESAISGIVESERNFHKTVEYE
jgi:hypothetical protein